MKTIKLLIVLFYTVCFLAIQDADAQSNKRIDSSILNDLTQKIESGHYPNFHSVIILYQGNIIYEKYFMGKDNILGTQHAVVQHSATTLHDMRSISKSVVSTCIGIAIKEGYIKNEEQRIAEFFPDYKECLRGAKKDWIIKDFLTMSTGLKWNEDISYDNLKNSERQMGISKDPIYYVFNQPLEHPVGKVFNYNGGATQVLGELIERSSKLPFNVFVDKYLFKPLGIENFEWTPFMNTQTLSFCAGLRLTSRDLVKLALLYRNNGIWNNQKILPEKWVNNSFSEHIEYPSELLEGNEAYGFQFWIWQETIGKTNASFAAAMGNGDQNIYWDLNNDLILITTAGNYDIESIKNDSYAMLKNHIFKAIFN
ncbi:serine hydrolase [uncultured Aquimarina sp.]|uniref:serine hydrolase domain-containing protein n=1 Tax=uncultured Aquimarina sp. TaxID=575652 RepID=UPI0026238663|nr:serine hydrolase [uncultured Aquimarina sp.]